ncbi:MAG: hypothetical protein ACRENL_05400, partial [Candidatus Dormibacteria bacterium]
AAGGATAPDAAVPTGVVGPGGGLPGSLHFEPGGQPQSFRPRRRRRRRGGGAAAVATEHGPGGGPEGTAPPPARVELPPAATG